MRILVTGATGFIGSQVCRELVARGIEVCALIRPSEAPLRLQDLAPRLTFLEHDLFLPTPGARPDCPPGCSSVPAAC